MIIIKYYNVYKGREEDGTRTTDLGIGAVGHAQSLLAATPALQKAEIQRLHIHQHLTTLSFAQHRSQVTEAACHKPTTS